MPKTKLIIIMVMLLILNTIIYAQAIISDNFIQFDRTDTTKCIWHDEKTGSMHYYKNQNRVKCFGCGQMGDTIDVIMQIYDTDMKGALKIILNN